ncbi:hypothetical protein CPY51_01675 [Rhizobium tubonense]|uniref:Uncharacterized protein n=1 Tax=Rhizobium tubonense TaxID=484088 RepID=A0A2W4D248_9HYPH|nr:hypothetical protein CPY51_01675 [Rhizobium tubonense]
MFVEPPLVRPSGTFSPRGEGGISHFRFCGLLPFSPAGRRWRAAPDEGAACSVFAEPPPPGNRLLRWSGRWLRLGILIH